MSDVESNFLGAPINWIMAKDDDFTSNVRKRITARVEDQIQVPQFGKLSKQSLDKFEFTRL